MQTLILQLQKASPIINFIFLAVIFTIIVLIFIGHDIALIYRHNHLQYTSSVSCSPWSNPNCYEKLIQKIHKAKHFILIKKPMVLENGEDVINALAMEEKRIPIKFILDKDLEKYHLFFLNDEVRLWIDTKPKSYEEKSSGLLFNDI